MGIDTRKVLLWAAAFCFAAPAEAAQSASKSQPAEVRVGLEEGDFRGGDHRALQAAIDYVAGLGGGTVHIGPGRYRMRNALTLRDNVRVVGVPGKTVLLACDGFQTPLAADGDCNERQITVANPSGFQVGDGVSIQDKSSAGGFAVTTATLTARLDANTFHISMPLYLDYMVSSAASARLVFPVVGGWKVKNVLIEGLTIDGNRGKSQALDGCRGGGIYLFESEAVTIRNCVVREYNGDGISFQVSQRVTVEDCLCENNGGLGLHPGSGSQYPVVRRNRSIGNGNDGLFVCWRVKHGLFENNEIRGNTRFGISIGHKDSDNAFRHNTCSGNGAAGVFFRNEEEAMGAHRNVFEENRIVDNCVSAKGEAKASIVIRGHHHDVVFRRNVIGNSSPGGAAAVGILSSEYARGLKADDNRFLNVKTEIETARP
jgi:parallel beta-helix repeat protein